MDKVHWMWITVWIVICGLANVATGQDDRTEISPDDYVLGIHSHQTCRENNVTFTWPKPENVTDFLFIDLIFVPDVPDNGSSRMLVFSLRMDGSYTVNNRYKGRLSIVRPEGKTMQDTYSFKLINVNPRDRGRYDMIVIATRGRKFKGAARLTVYAEDNLWPIGEKDVNQEEGVYRYPFIRRDESPVVGIKMSLPNTQVEDTCYFGNSSRCELVFTTADLQGISGTVWFDVVPKFEEDHVFMCHAVKKTYDYKVTMMRAKLSSALIGGICISVFIAIAACVIPPVIIHIKNKREKYIPLKGGYGFIKGCIERIEETPDVSDVYRKNANSKMIHPHIKGYFQDPKAREGFFQDEGVTKIYFAAFIKYYIKNVCEPLISDKYINKVKDGCMSDEKGDRYNLSELRAAFTVKKKKVPTATLR